jgi:hypothetical protein
MFQFTGFASLTYVFSKGYSLLSGFPHSDIYGSKLHCQLPVAFRRLARPSSPVIAKASTTCTYSLDPITLYSLSRVATGNSYLCCLVLAVNTRTDAITTCCQRLISAATQPSSILLKNVAIDCSKAKDKQPCLSLGFGGG